MLFTLSLLRVLVLFRKPTLKTKGKSRIGKIQLVNLGRMDRPLRRIFNLLQ